MFSFRSLWNFRTLFAIILSLILAGIGLYLGLLLPDMPGFWGIPDGKDLIRSIRGFDVFVPIMLVSLGLLVGGWLGPKAGGSIVNVGKSLEQMSAADKIAVMIGATLGVFLALPVYLLVLNPIVNILPPIKIGLLALLSVVFLYFGIIATVSMKNELVNILSRGGGVNSQEVEEEAKPTKGCKILDTNVIIDGRIADIRKAGFIEGTLYVPGFVLEELQHIADSGDGLKRARGRRGLDILNAMQEKFPLIVRQWDKALDRSAQHDEVDTRLVKLAKALEGTIVTNDFNLNKVASLQNVPVLNINELANALKPVVLPGEVMAANLVKEGKEPSQGVAYLDDGTMIVVEDGRRLIGTTVPVVVTSVLQTVAGKMIFAKLRDEEEGIDSDRRERGDGVDPERGYRESGGSYPRRGPGKKVRQP